MTLEKRKAGARLLGQLSKIRQQQAEGQPRHPAGHPDGGQFAPKAGSSGADSELEQLSTAEQASAWLGKKYPNISWGIADFDHGLAVSSAKQFHKLAQDFPGVAERLGHVGDPKKSIHPEDQDNDDTPGETIRMRNFFRQRRDAIGVASTSSGLHLGLNPDVYTDREAFEARITNDENRGWSIAGSSKDPAAYIMAHEFGHSVWAFLSSSPDARQSKGRTLSAFDQEKKGDYTATMSDVAKAWQRNNVATQELSTYSTANPDEGFAEAFASIYRTPPEKHTEYTKSLQKLLKFSNSPPPKTKAEFLAKLKEMNIGDWD